MANESEPLASIVVLGWNNVDIIDECLKSIQAQTYKNCSIIYVDNGSEDGSVEYVRKNYPKIIVVDTGKNNGFAIGNNIGMKKALENKDCKYVGLLNTDATIAKDWLETLIAFGLDHPKAGSMQTPTYDYYDHRILDSYGIVVDHYGRAMQVGYRSERKAPSTRIMFGTNAAASLFSRSFLESQPFGDDYLDSDLWMYLEDVDIAARATLTGWNNWFVNKSSAYHMGSASSNKRPGFSVFRIYRNNFPMIYKNFPLSILLRMIPGLILTDCRTIIELIRGRNKVALKAMLRGRVDGFALIPVMYKKRKIMLTHKTISNHDLWQLMRS
jgi:GT2 family glycosyltransferase